MKAIDALQEKSDAYGLDWEDSDKLEIVCQFIDENVEDEDFQQFLKTLIREQM
jgi:hypothetical protein